MISSTKSKISIKNECTGEDNNNNKNNSENNVDNVDNVDNVNNTKLDNLLLNLRIISEIKEFDKLRVNNDNDNLKIDQSSLMFLTRWYFSEGRENTIIKINNVLNETFEYIETIKSNRYENANRDIQRILIGLTTSLKGIECLKVTYKKDINVITNLNLYSEKICIKINELNTTIKLI